jgi:hypothetical protein
MAIGLIDTADDGMLKVRNRLYESVFTARWANENLPLHWRGPAIAIGIDRHRDYFDFCRHSILVHTNLAATLCTSDVLADRDNRDRGGRV